MYAKLRGMASDWAESDVTLADGATIHVYRRGNGPPVVLAHGATDNGRCWTRVAEQLESDYELIGYDARGHGKSSDIPEPPCGAGDDLVGVVTALGLDRPVAIGHSMGAGAVADAAARADTPLRAAILEDPGWRATELPPVTRASSEEKPSASRARSLTGWVEGLQRKSLEEVIATGRAAMPTWHPDELPGWAESKLQYRPAARGGTRPPARPWREVAAAISIPTLLVCGDPRKALVDEAAADEAKQLCPTLEVVRFPDAGHNIRREAFEGFVDAVRGFLSKV